MPAPKLITVRGKPIAGGKHPVICTPLVGKDTDLVLAEVAAVLPKAPDVIEWRADFFGAIGNTEQVIATAEAIRSRAGGIPVIFTIRSAREGGQALPIDEAAVVRLLEAVCRARCTELVDYEMGNPAEHVQRVREAARASGVALVLSYHNFKATPDEAALVARFREAQEKGGDVAKVAVMPQSLRDVLTLLSATLVAHETLDIPLLSMSMGPFGSITRMIGWAFGSTLTFAVGQSSSAPGQVPIDDLRTVLAIAERAFGQPR